MQERLQRQPLYIGIDVSKLTLDICCLTLDGAHNYQQFENTKTGLRRLHQWLLQREDFAYATALFCMEHTGIYTRLLVESLLLQGAKIWMESALHLK